MKWVEITVLLIVGLLTSLEDIKHQTISNRKVLFCFVSGVLISFINGTFKDALYGFFAGFILLYVLGILFKGGIGGGDIKLLAAYGLFLGWESILLAQLICFTSAFIFILVRKIHDKHFNNVVLAPFISLAVIFTFILNLK